MASANTELVVRGMNCTGCANSVTQALNAVPGVANADVSLQEGRARVRWSDGQQNAETLDQRCTRSRISSRSPRDTTAPKQIMVTLGRLAL